jgi:DNA-binding winged helix-turn-helix (wHTH) protein/Tol biopolymer transport system component
VKESVPSSIVFRFGPFELCAESGELKKSGTLLKLQPQPARLLMLLVSHPGQIVKREQIQQAVWGNEIAVDFDLGVNRCIRQIRSILLDNPESPRYIKTVPRQGYSFIAPVEQIRMDVYPEPPTEAENRSNAHSVAPLQETPELDSRLVKHAVSSSIPSPTENIPVKRPGKLPGVGWSFQSLALVIACVLIVVGIVQYLRLPPPIPRVESYSQLTNDSYDKVIRSGEFARSIFADSSRVYFSVFTGAATSQIAEVAQAGGDTSLVQTSLTSPVLLDYSASRSELLLSSGTGIGAVDLWVQPVPAGSARQISGVTAQGASWSPDGEWMVYASQSNLYLASRSGTNSKLLARFDARRGQRPYWLRWSANGRSIRFSVYDRSLHANSLWEISSSGGDPHRILWDGEAHQDRCCGSWTVDGHYYLFVSSDAGRSDIWAVPTNPGIAAKLKGSLEPMQLTAGPLSYSAPAPSQDGKTIFVLGEARRGELVRYDASAGNFESLAAGVSASQADFSRDGKRLAFVSFRDGSLWQSRADGTERVQLVFPPLKIASPRWSPDGTRVAFFGHLPDEPTAVYVISDHGGDAQKLVPVKDHDQMDPDWSPDGQRLVFSDTSRTEQVSVIKIFDFKMDETSTVTGSNGLRSPRWSPDGRYISALTADLSHLMLYDYMANQWVQLAHFRMGYPNWSHDSRYIYLVNLAHGAGICRVRVADHQIESIVDMTRRNQYWTDDAWLGLTPQDTPLLSRDISIQQIFALRWAVK